tara:strand:+ start:1541 stop:1771 length:231 start_codon:yes stop_codon:yes gene_type:complete
MDRWHKHRQTDKDSFIFVSREMSYRVAEYMLLKADLEDDTKNCLLDCLRQLYFTNKELYLKHLKEYRDNEEKRFES